LQPTVDIYYGSQTGTAEGYAKQISSHAKKLGYKTRLLGLAKYKREDLIAGGVAIFVVATYGEGDPTDDAIDFTQWLRSPSTPKLPNLKFAVFGLGNRQYEQYNKMGQVGGHLTRQNH
jgi:NADPH-ferrihemoprotein reductase